jgi:type VI secretion system protein ImpK
MVDELRPKGNLIATGDEDATIIQTVSARKAESSSSSINLGKEYSHVARSSSNHPQAVSSASANSPANSLLAHGQNKLLNAATNILAVIAELKRPQQNLDLSKLRQHLTAEVNSFDVKAKSYGIPETNLVLARYVLCAVSDEFVLDTPWGANSNWSEYSLLSVFHQDSAGGQKFFSILEKISQEPTTNLELIELMYICLTLGFVGKYRITERGHDQLSSLKQNVYKQIRAQRGDQHIALATVIPAKAKQVNRVQQIPFLKLAAITAASLLVIYLILHFIIRYQTSNVTQELRNLVVDNAVLKQTSKRSAI